MCEKTCCPLLADPLTYNPDTIDLSQDPEAASYWFECFKEIGHKFAKQAASSQKNDPTVNRRADDFRNEYLEQLQVLQNLASNRTVTIRQLLNLSESCLRMHGFHDPWFEQKCTENEVAISAFKSRIDEIDVLDCRERWTELIKGVLAGNIFDWGAQVVTEILENNRSFGLHDALSKIQKRPWLVDNLDLWHDRLENPPHKCAAIFVDNSGVDVVLGILPFTRELLKQKTKVILCANTEPSLNDVTLKELNEILNKCSSQCDIIKSALDSKELLVFGNGQQGPCLDMAKISEELSTAMTSNHTDLLVIEGMARSLHTNLNAKFCCETLKLAVVKNKWLANRLGGDMFSVICKYENL